MKTAGWILAFFLLIAVIVLWKCPAEPVNDRVAELEKQLAESEARFKVMDDSIKLEVAKRDSMITDLTAEKEILSGELKIVGSQVTELTQRIRHAKVVRDTVTYYVSCDSLVVFADSLAYTIREYEYIVDSLLITYGEQLEAKDSMIKSRDQLYSEMRIAFNTVAQDYKDLSLKYGKEVKKHRLSKKLNIILGSAVIVLSGILIVN